MTLRRILPVMLGLGLVCSGVRAAEPDPVYGTPSDPLAVVALHNFAECVASRNSAGPVAVLAMDFRTDAYRDALRRLARGHNYCTTRNSQLRFNGLLFSGGLAEALITRGITGTAVAVPRGPTEALSYCVVGRVPDAVRALLRTEPASDAEVTAFEPIGPALQACVASGTLTTNKPALRALLALATYRPASTSPAATPAPTN